MITNHSAESYQNGYYIGIMSGTSLDGMDVVIARFSEELQLIATHSKSFDKKLQTVLTMLCEPNGVDRLAENTVMSELDWFGLASRDYAEFASDVVNELLIKSKILADQIVAIGCHGQTVRHRPEHAFTLQLLDPNILAERTGITVISDFRRRDMAVGGQGAPLVPAFHQAMFTSRASQRVLLNLGGIANITVLANSDNPDQVIGYDTGPANLLLDAWAKRHIDRSYDENGDFARSGKVIDSLLQQLLTHDYFARTAPKSTGREDFHLEWVDSQLEKFKQQFPTLNYSPADIQATLTELTAVSVCNDIARYGKQDQNNELFVCGGGAYNGYLLARLQSLLSRQWQVLTTEPLGLAPTWVEGVAFAWLARQTMMRQVANLPAVTGARKSVVLGQVCFA